MKRFVVLAVACLTVALVASGTAGARSTALTPAEKNLQKQVNGVKGDITALKKQVAALKKANTALADYAQLGVGYTACSNVVAADELQATWKIIDELSVATQAGKTYFGAQTPIDDQGICTTAFGVSRSAVTPPTTAPYAALVNLVFGSAVLTKHVAL